MNITIFGAGVQGTLYGIRLARNGHNVTLIARGSRAAELNVQGAAVRSALTGHSDQMRLPVVEKLAPDTNADLCFVLIRREQIEEALVDLKAASAIRQFVFMVNHASGSEKIFAELGRKRVVLGFPSFAGSIESGVDVFLDVTEQATSIERSSPEVAALLKNAGFHVRLVKDMDSWLKRHAVFVTAIAGALFLRGCDPKQLSYDPSLVRTFILGVRQGWLALDQRGIAPAPLALRSIFSWIPLPLAAAYWRHLFASPRGEFYFARHTRRSIEEVAALVADVRELTAGCKTPDLDVLYKEIDGRQPVAGRRQRLAGAK